MGLQDTVNLLEQLDGPSRQLPSGARPSTERPVHTAQVATCLLLLPNPNVRLV